MLLPSLQRRAIVSSLALRVQYHDRKLVSSEKGKREMPHSSVVINRDLVGGVTKNLIAVTFWCPLNDHCYQTITSPDRRLESPPSPGNVKNIRSIRFSEPLVPDRGASPPLQ
jgi:hypothetical protein